MQTEPVAEHHWLKKFVGVWTISGTCDMGPEQGEAIWSSEERVRLLGDLWVVGEATGTMPDDGEAMTSLITIGFDPAKGRFVGSWVGSPMAYMFVYEGTLDEERRVLTLETRGPAMHDPTELVRYQDIVEWLDDDTRTLRSVMHPSGGGEVVEMMRATYTRTG